jgi:formylmethanofuran dehydrogenase subunit E
MKLNRGVVALTSALALFASTGRAETPEEWIQLGARIHGGFGALIPAGIRIGLDAQERLKPERRGLVVTYYSGANAPCPCIADGIMIATQTSPGQGTLQVAQEKAPAGLLAVAIVRNRKTGEGLRYADEWLPKLLDWNKMLDPAGRYEAAMKADGLFQVEADQTR